MLFSHVGRSLTPPSAAPLRLSFKMQAAQRQGRAPAGAPMPNRGYKRKFTTVPPRFSL